MSEPTFEIYLPPDDRGVGTAAPAADHNTLTKAVKSLRDQLVAWAASLTSTFVAQVDAQQMVADQLAADPTVAAAAESAVTSELVNGTAGNIYARVDGSRGVWDAIAEGAAGDGTTNDTAAIQATLNAIEAAGGGTLVLAPGRSFKVSQLLLGNDTTLHMVGARIVRTGSAGGSGGATLRNKDQVAGNTNIAVQGGRIVAGSATDTGKHVAFLGVAGLAIDGLWVERPYSDWAFFLRDCDRVTIGTLTISGGATAIFEDGFHIEGCRDMAVGVLNVEAGDDAVALVQTLSTTREMRNITFGAIVASSAAANLFKIEVDPDATAGVRGVTVGSMVGDKTGATAGNAIWIMDQGGGKRVSRVTVANAQIDAAGSAGAAVIVESATDIDLDGVHVDAPDGVGFDILNVDRLTLRGCSTRATRGATVAGMRLRGVTEFAVDGCRVTGATQHAYIIGAATMPAVDGSIRSSVARSCPGNGIHLDYATFVDVTDNRIKGCAWAIREEGGGCADNLITGNDVRGNTATVSAAAGDYNGTLRDRNFGAGNRIHTFTANDTTPSVRGGNLLHKTANTAATSVTALDDGVDGQVVTVIVADGNTTFVHSASLRLEGAVNWTATTNDTISFVRSGGVWIETARSAT